MEISRGPSDQVVSSPGPHQGPEVAAYQRGSVLADCLRPASIILGLLYVLFGMAYAQLPPPDARVLSPPAFATAVLLLGLSWALGRYDRWQARAHLLAATVAGLVLVNVLLHLVVTRDPLQVINLVLLIVGAAFLFSSTTWLIGLVLVIQMSWWSIALSPLGDRTWIPYGLGLVAASALSLMIHLARSRSHQYLQNLRRLARKQSFKVEERARQLETLIDLSHEMNQSLDLGGLLHHVGGVLRARFGYDYVAVFLLEPGEQGLALRAATGEEGRELVESGHRVPLGEDNLIGTVAERREPMILSASAEPEGSAFASTPPSMGSEMALPLETGGALVGVLDIRAEAPDAFDETDLRLCLSLAGQLAMAIQNASRYELEHSRRLLTEHLYAVGRALSRTLETPEILDLILDSLGQIVSFDRASVLLARGDELEIVAARGFPAESNPQEIRVPITKDDVYDRICRTKAPLVLPQIRASDGWKYVDDLPRAQSWVGLPLIDAADEVIGMLSLTREAPEPYTEEEAALGTAFAGQAGVALQNARLYMELSQAYQQLERLDRAKSDFISLASHELRTPLTVMMGYTHMLLREPLMLEDPGAKMMIEGLEVGVTRLQEIVDRMVDVAEIESQHLQLHYLPISLYELLEEVSWSFTDVAKERHLTLSVEDFSMLPDVEADHVNLYKVFYHLLMNAVKYTPDGGDIRISAREVKLDRSDRQVPGIDVMVRDTGIGIDPDHHEKIFGKFFQLGEVTLHSSSDVNFGGGGPGLGLAIVRGIVEAHGGRVWVESPGYDAQACPGSCFHVVLPLEQPAKDM
ncbi:MAG: GAF domain-containing protein [Anaerolineae bacterium]